MIKSGYPYFQERHNAIYDILEFVEPGLCLDIGAAAGQYTRLMRAKTSQSEVIAFEPFPGNLPYFNKNNANDPMVRLINAAVSDETGEQNFFVGSTVQGSESGWETMKGYSSVGQLVSDNDKRTDKIIKVKTVRVDDVIGDREVPFVKIDVQGAEHSVLKSASRGLATGRIKMLFVEFDGSANVIDFLLENAYLIFDSEYLLIPLKNDPDMSGWNIYKEMTLSTGRQAFRAWPKAMPEITAEYIAWFASEKKKLGALFNDLVAVHKDFVPQFKNAASLANAKY